MRKTLTSIVLILTALLLAAVLSGCDSTGILPPTSNAAFASLRADGPQTQAQPLAARRAARLAAKRSHQPRGARPRGSVPAGSINIYVWSEPAMGMDRKVSTAAGEIYSVHMMANGTKGVFNAPVGDYVQLFLATVPAQGQTASDAVQITTDNNDHWYPQLSPDGTQVVYVQGSEGHDRLCLVSASGGTPNCLTIAGFDPTWYETPTIAPNGKIVVEAYNCVSGCAEGQIIDNIFEINADGSGTPRQITNNDGSIYTYYETPSLSSDGATMVVSRYVDAEGSYQEIYLFDMASRERTGPLTNGQVTGGDSYDPLFVGDKIVYASETDNDSNSRLYVMDKTGANATAITPDTYDNYFDDDYW